MISNLVELYDGTSWTETTEINTSRRNIGVGAAVNTAVLIWGGNDEPSPPFSYNQLVELWNGSSWTEVADLGTARRNYGAGGPSASGILTGGTGDTNGTEEWTVNLVNKTITAS